MDKNFKVAILSHGDVESLHKRFGRVFEEFTKTNFTVEPVVYKDEYVDELRDQISKVDGVLVWANPIADKRNRSILDDMLRDVASKGVFVSTHPDVILKMGTKEVLYQTLEMGWSGGDIHLYTNVEELRQQLPSSLGDGSPRVLKQNRGNNGMGVWRVELVEGLDNKGSDPIVRVLHAERNSTEIKISLSEFINQCEIYFEGSGQMIDQPFYSPLPKGMVRCYMSQNQVVGFGHQYVTALLRTEDGKSIDPQPRIYYPESKTEFQSLKSKLEDEWIPQLMKLLAIDTESLPIIWDADFLFGTEKDSGEETYVLCEINVSSVYPFPESALSKFVEKAAERISERNRLN